MDTTFQVGDRVRGTSGREGPVTKVHSDGAALDVDLAEHGRYEAEHMRRAPVAAFTLVSRAETPEPEWHKVVRDNTPVGLEARFDDEVFGTGGYSWSRNGEAESGVGWWREKAPRAVRENARTACEDSQWPPPIFLDDPRLAQAEPPRAFQVGDRVNDHSAVAAHGRPHAGRITDITAGMLFVHCGECTATVPIVANEARERLTLITPAAPVTLDGDAAVLPDPVTEPPARECAACFRWSHEMDVHEVAADTYLCRKCFAERGSPTEPPGCMDCGCSREKGCVLCTECCTCSGVADNERCPTCGYGPLPTKAKARPYDEGGTNPAGFPTMPVPSLSDAMAFIAKPENQAGLAMYRGEPEPVALDAFIAARESQPEPKPAPRLGDLCSAWYQEGGEEPKRIAGVVADDDTTDDRCIVLRRSKHCYVCFRAGAEVVTKREVL
jgi:hypothetical protein